MIENQKIRPAQVIGPLGEPLTIDSLPHPSTTRWVVRRKAEVVSAVNGGLLSVDEACERYGLSLEEFAGWQRAVDRSGMPGLQGHPHPALQDALRAPAELLSRVRGAPRPARPEGRAASWPGRGPSCIHSSSNTTVTEALIRRPPGSIIVSELAGSVLDKSWS